MKTTLINLAMAIKIKCSAKYFKVGNRNFDKITQEYDPPCHWFRLKIKAKGKAHNKCIGHIMRMWHADGRMIKGFDPLVMFWVNEPPVSQQRSEGIAQEHYRVDIAPQNYELAGFAHIKLPSSERDQNLPIPPDNRPADQCPEFLLNRSRNENEFTSKRFKFAYGIYYIEVVISDGNGHKAKKIFKVWGYPDKRKCQIRTTRFYERAKLSLKSVLPAV